MSKPQVIGRRAFVLGYTGEVGRVLTRRLLESNAFERIVLIGRRKVENDGSVDGEAYAKCVSGWWISFLYIFVFRNKFKSILTI
jgi:hypothetical protein